MIRIFTFLFLALTGSLFAQKIATFEELNIPQDSFFNDAGAQKQFVSGGIILPNSFTSTKTGGYWSGWSISTKKDTTTVGYLNQYSSITGSGYEGSQTYAVNFGNSTIKLSEEEAKRPADGFYITNSTYAYLSMLNGDSFAKKFGGEDGKDPDYFKVTFYGMKGGSVVDSSAVYLADFRSDDNSKDYILKEWLYVDLKPMGAIDSLTFAYASSDVGQYGINTPKYICIDNFKTGSVDVSTWEPSAVDFAIYPNPTTHRLTVDNSYDSYTISTLAGSVVATGAYTKEIEVERLPASVYILSVTKGGRSYSKTFVKE